MVNSLTWLCGVCKEKTEYGTEKNMVNVELGTVQK